MLLDRGKFPSGGCGAGDETSELKCWKLNEVPGLPRVPRAASPRATLSKHSYKYTNIFTQKYYNFSPAASRAATLLLCSVPGLLAIDAIYMQVS